MVHIQTPDEFNGYRWEVYVEDRHGAETIRKDFPTEKDAINQAREWREEMDRTGIVIGARHASYEL